MMEDTTMQTTLNTRNGARVDASFADSSFADSSFDAARAGHAVTALAPDAAPHDLLTRLRDKWGHRLPWGSAFSIPTVDDTPLEQTPLAPALRVIAAVQPARAATLHHLYDIKLLDAGRRFRQVLAEELARLDVRNREAAGHNTALDAQKEALEQTRDAKTLADRDALTALEDGPLPDAHAVAAEKYARAGGVYDAHAVAAEKYARAGGVYDAHAPSEDGVLRHGHRALDILAAELGLPGPHGDAHAHLPGWLGWALTGAVGALMGVSLGLVTHILEADTLVRHLPVAAGFALIGFGLAAAAKWAVRGAWYRVGQDYYLGTPRSKWGWMLAGALLRSVIVLAVDVVLERQGLLALMQLQADTQALTGHASGLSLLDQAVSWVVPLVVTLAYLYCAGDAGYLDGRREEVKNRLTARQEQEWAATDATRRADPAVQDALHALANVRELLRRRDGLQVRIAALAAPFDAEIAALEPQRLPEREDLDTAARHRIQDALDNFHGAQWAFDAQWEEALAACEPSGGFWRRLLRAVGGGRPARRTRREDRSRGGN